MNFQLSTQLFLYLKASADVFGLPMTKVFMRFKAGSVQTVRRGDETEFFFSDKVVGILVPEQLRCSQNEMFLVIGNHHVSPNLGYFGFGIANRVVAGYFCGVIF